MRPLHVFELGIRFIGLRGDIAESARGVSVPIRVTARHDGPVSLRDAYGLVAVHTNPGVFRGARPRCRRLPRHSSSFQRPSWGYRTTRSGDGQCHGQHVGRPLWTTGALDQLSINCRSLSRAVAGRRRVIVWRQTYRVGSAHASRAGIGSVAAFGSRSHRRPEHSGRDDGRASRS
jgi:hypothetical protein